MVIVLICNSLTAQDTFFNNADLVYVAKDAELHVFGNILSTGNATFLTNQGLIQTYNDVNIGDFELNNGSTVKSKGDYKIENDWINNATLIIDSGLVELYGANQWITGSQISYFWNLLLTGTDLKELAIDAHVKSTLDITSREFAVHDKKLFIDSSNFNAILYDQSTLNGEGIISTDEDGTIRKCIKINELNIIPTGSSNATFRHRPVILNKLSGSILDTAIVTFHNHTPNLLNLMDTQLDDSLCEIQTRYFYTINNGDQNAIFQLDFAHYPIADDEYRDLATWNNPLWRNISNKANLAFNNYQYVRALSFSNFNEQHFSLARATPLAPYIVRDTLNCYPDANYIVETPQDQFNYNWDIFSSTQVGNIINGQGTIQVDVNWGSGAGGAITLTYDDLYGCTSFKDSMRVYDAGVIADFSYGNYNSVDFDTEFQFVNNSSSSATDIEWAIGNYSESRSGFEMAHPFNYTFSENGESAFYEIILIAHNNIGDCYDTMVRLIEVPDIFVFYAPNSFTPDGDGINDLFYCESSNTKKITLEIYNRWGEQLFQQEAFYAEDIRWDGTYKGKIIQTGTYTYRFVVWPKNYNNAEVSVKEYTGFVNLLR